MAVLALAFAPTAACADMMNNGAMHDHADATLARASRDHVDRHELLADRVTLNLGVAVPIYGSYALDQRVFGGVRPSAVVFDWILGGAAPAALGITALADGGLSARTRSTLGWTALGLYASTRIGVLVIGNLHISEYNRYIKLRAGITEGPSGQLAPALVAGTSW
jgi:hypothetical protein